MDDKVRERVRRDPESAAEEKARYAGHAYLALTDMGVPPQEANIISMLLGQATFSEKYEEEERTRFAGWRARIRATVYAARRFLGHGG